MKTFKAVRFQIVSENGGVTEYELEDGVIINKEGSGTGWLLEIVISNEHYHTFKEYKDNEKTMSIVFECHIYTLRQVYAESLLEELVNDGLTGEELKKTFNRMMQSKPKLKDEKFER